MNKSRHIRPLTPAPTPGARSLVPPAPWRASWLLASPHRLGFFAAALMLALSALWWAALLFASALGRAPPWAVPPPAAHALLMSLGFMPLFMAGFLFTAGPKWLGQAEVKAQRLLWPVLVMLA
ncbi:MAG: NnrS family protein, partial [Gammaproteobacteria bacterium]|nr:NnrS family protein [Gammaproteobacteria bacterium]